MGFTRKEILLDPSPTLPPHSFSLADFETNYQLPEFSEEIWATC